MHHVGWFKSSHFLLDPMCLVSILVFLVCTNMLLVNINSHDLKHKQFSWFIARGKSYWKLERYCRWKNVTPGNSNQMFYHT